MAQIVLLKPQPFSFYGPVVAAAGALAGLFVGTAQGSGLAGIVLGAVLAAGIAWGLTHLSLPRRAARWGLAAIFAVLGFVGGGVMGLIVGAAFGAFFGWFPYWLADGRYRAGLPPYLTAGQVLWEYSFLVICGFIFFFLIAPIIIIMGIIGPICCIIAGGKFTRVSY